MARDPYKYFRIEARELTEGLMQGVLGLEKAPSNKDELARLLRLAHTLKGASRVVKLPSIADAAHAIEDLLAAHRKADDGAVSLNEVNQLLGLVDSIAAAIKALEPALEDFPHRTAPPAVEDSFQTVRVAVEEMDGLLENVFESSIQLGTLARLGADFESAERLSAALLSQLETQSESNRKATSADGLREMGERLHQLLLRNRREWTTRLDSIFSEMNQIRSQANTLRLLSASAIFASLERAARDATRSSKKEIEFKTSGGENRLDGHILARLRDALLHVVRNAVDHGLEAPGERIRLGKSQVGVVRLEVERRGNRMVFSCTDDGRGIDQEQVRKSAIGQGLISHAEANALSSEEAMRLIFRAGVSTSSAVTEVSGRGIGLDVVRETVERFKGEVRVTSKVGQGTRIEISAPVSLSSFTALVVESAGVAPALPLDSVRKIVRLSHGEIGQGSDQTTILYEGAAIPFVVLSSALGKQSALKTNGLTLGVVIQSASGLAAFAVDRLKAIADLVVKPLPTVVGTFPILAGVAFDSDGDPQPILDPDGLVAFARHARTPPATVSPERNLPLLVIDDSLTTRMLEQSILESAGFEVDLATSAEEGMEKARLRHYGLFIVDVQMPGMDGFEFVARTRADPVLRDTPAMLVTSLNSDEDRRRGMEAGSRYFMAKGDFNQDRFLETIRNLTD